MARTSRRTPQSKVTIPPADWPAIEAAMEWDGVKNFSQFALAAIRQRVRRIQREKAAEESATKSAR